MSSLRFNGPLPALDRLGQDLQCYLPAEHRVLGAEDPPHRPLAQQADQAEPPDALAHPDSA